MDVKEVKQRLTSLFIVFVVFIGGAIVCIPFVLYDYILVKRRPLDLLSYDGFGHAIFTLFWKTCGESKDPAELKKLDTFFHQAHGVILDLGPGAGFTVKHFDASKCTKIFGIEPNTDFHPQLRQRVVDAGLSDIYTIVPCGVEDLSTMAKYGIQPESFDTIVACKVLCSVPKPDVMCKNLYGLLAPGGSLVALEHIRSTDYIAGPAQNFAEKVWPLFFAGCHLTRPTTSYLLEAGPWKEREVGTPAGSTPVDIIPFMVGKFTK